MRAENTQHVSGTTNPNSCKNVAELCPCCVSHVPGRSKGVTPQESGSAESFHVTRCEVILVCQYVEGRRNTVVCNERRKPHTSHYLSRPVAIKTRRERLKSALYLRLKKRKVFKLVKGDLCDFLITQSVAKYRRN